MRAVWPMGLVALLLSGCAGWGGREPATIASVPAAVPPAEDTAVVTARMRAIRAYEGFLANSAANDPMRAEATRRLADLRREEREARELAQTGDPGLAEVGEYVPLYEALLASHATDPRNDQVRYQLARAYEEQGRPEQAVDMLESLVRQNPDSPLATEAQFRRGEILFVDRDYARATDAYAAVIARGSDTPFFAHSRYKLGWAHYKLSQYPEALDAFTASLDHELPGGGADLAKLSRADRERVDDTLRAMGLSFIAEGGPAAVARYYDTRGNRAYEDVVMEGLAATYLAKEQYTDAADTYHLFTKRHPLHARAPEFDQRAIDALAAGGFPRLVLDAKVEFASRYRLDAEYWRHHDPAARPEVVALLKTTVADLARHFHAQAQASKKPADYREAQRWYKAYVTSFPNDPETPGMHFLLAEVMQESGQWVAAVGAYEHTAYRYPLHARSAEAGYAALLAYPRATETLPAAQRAAWQRQAIDSALLFEATYSGHRQAAPVLTQAAERLYQGGEAQQARVNGERLLERYPDADAGLRRTAWTVVGHASFDLGDYPAAEQAYAIVLTEPARAARPEEVKARQALEERLAAAIYKQGEAARAAGDLRLASQHFLRVGQRVPDAKIRPTAEYDAASALLELEAWAEAASVLERFRVAYPNHPSSVEVDRRLAAAYLRSGQGLKAGRMYENYAGRVTDPTLRREALGQAGDLYRAAGATGEEGRVLATYIQTFPRPLEPAIEARQRLADLSREAGDARREQAWLQALVEAERAGGAERTDRTRYLAGTALLTLAAPKAKAYRDVRLVEPIKRNLREKKQRMELAIDAYGQAVDYGLAEVVTAATYQIANLYYDFSRALMDSERPKGLSADELEQYEILLEEQAFPFEEKAISVYEINVKRIPEGVYDQWVRKSIEQLARLLPVRYAKSERNVALVDIAR